MRRLSLCAGLLVLALGCGGGTKSGPTVTWANSATLTGDPVGQGTETPDQLTRIIPADISGAGVTGSSGVLGRVSTTSQLYRFLAPVTNHGTRRQCFLQTETFDFLDANGAVLNAHTTEWVTGSVAS